MRLSPHFTLEEMIHSDYAARHGLDNTPGGVVIGNLQRTCDMLESVRVLCGNRPIHVSSGYRGPDLNAAIGGSRTSAHMDGRAADFVVPGLSVRDVVERIIKAGFDYDQVIYEFGRWIHLGIAKSGVEPRREALQILSPGKYEFFK